MTLVRDYSIFDTGVRFGGDQAVDRPPQVINPLAGQRRDFYDTISAGQFADRFLRKLGAQVAFIDGVETDGKLIEQFNLFRGKSRCRFDDGDDQVGLADCGLRSFDADPFDDVLGLPDSRGVYQVHRDAVDDERFIQRIARGAGQVGDDRSLSSEQRVKDRRFADVRTPDQREFDSRADELSQSVTGGERAESFDELIQALEEGGDVQRVEIVFDEFDRRLEVNDHLNESLFYRLQPLGDFPSQLPGG